MEGKTRFGSTSIIEPYARGALRTTLLQNLSAFDVGTCSHQFPGIDEARVQFNHSVFVSFREKGIPNHYRTLLSPTSFKVREYQVYRIEDGVYVLQDPLSGMADGIVLPIECIERFVITQGVIDRVKEGSLTLERLGLSPDAELSVGMELPEPFVEFTTKLEKKDRSLGDEEAASIAQITAAELEQCKQLELFAGDVLRERLVRAGLRLIDFKIELGRAWDGTLVVVDKLTPDEMRIWDDQGRSLDKDPFRNWLKSVGFKSEVDKARANGEPLPAYPDVPDEVSEEVSAGYREVVHRFQQAAA